MSHQSSEIDMNLIVIQKESLPLLLSIDINNLSCPSDEVGIESTYQETFVMGLNIESIGIVPITSSDLLFLFAA